MKMPEDLDEMITLYLYDELSDDERREFEAHLEFNEESRRRLAAFRALHTQLNRRNVPQPTNDWLKQSRAALRRQLQSEELQSSVPARIRHWFGDLQLPSALQLTGAAAFLFLGMIISRFVLSPEALPPASDLIQVTDSQLPPVISSVDLVEYEPKTGLVTVHYKEVQDLQTQGNVNDSAVRRLLSHTIRRETHPGRRLAAVRATFGNAFSDSDLEKALIHAMVHDSVAGVRLRAAKTLKTLPINKDIQLAFIHILLNDPNPAMRMQAVEGLSASDERDVMSVFQKSSKGDQNDFVRLETARALERRWPEKRPQKL